MSIDYKNLNKVRVHNRNESVKHFMIKAMTMKLFFNAGYTCYTEREVESKVADVLVLDKKDRVTVVEIETKPSKKHTQNLLSFYSIRNCNLYIINVQDVPNDIVKMGEFLKYKLGL